MSGNHLSRSSRTDRRGTMRIIAKGLLTAGIVTAAPMSATARSKHPVPPCEAAPAPVYSPADAPPAFAIWQEADLRDWQPPQCLNWSGPTASAEAIAATFRFSGTDADLLAHIGNLALHPTIKYWSATRRNWRPLITSAEVVADVTGRPAASAFTASDFTVGKVNYYAETTSDSGRVIYRMQTLFRSPERIVLATDNATAIRSWGFTVFEPGALQSVIVLETRSAGLWTYYAIVRAGLGASRVARGQSASYVNRLVALFRFTAGIPTDAEPPAVR